MFKAFKKHDCLAAFKTLKGKFRSKFRERERGTSSAGPKANTVRIEIFDRRSMRSRMATREPPPFARMAIPIILR
jgi:hypothetical protein